MAFKEFFEQHQHEGWGDNFRKGFLGTAIGAASLMPNYAQAQQPVSNVSAMQSVAYSHQELQHIINILSEQLSRGMAAKHDQIMNIAKQDRNFSTFPDKAIRSAALSVTVGPILGLNGNVKDYQLVDTAENYIKGKEDNSQVLRIRKVENFGVLGKGLKGVIRASFNADGKNIDVAVDTGGEYWVTAALIHKLGQQALGQKSSLAR